MKKWKVVFADSVSNTECPQVDVLLKLTTNNLKNHVKGRFHKDSLAENTKSMKAIQEEIQQNVE